VKAINSARKTIEIVIFRFDRREIERALANAVHRGVAVRALIAHTNRSGEAALRQLEMRLLADGVVVSRTADDLIRYHSKLMVVDRRDLFVLAFNLAYADIERSRSFGVVTRSAPLVREALQLFEADVQRRPYDASLANFVVSPSNARKQLSKFIGAARQELLIYDPEVSDPAMVRILESEVQSGVDIRIIGRLGRPIPGILVRKLDGLRLHTRTMVRDGRTAFVGSQSMREAELDSRREVGLIFREAAVVNRIRRVFLEDWETAVDRSGANDASLPRKVAKRVAKMVVSELPPLAAVLNAAVKEVAGGASVEVNSEAIQNIVEDAVKEAVKEAVTDAVEETVQPERKIS
jgi:phosphatidylserine/phosphatidylglycerophosphate/cardiolipin synthase-like enzyme